MEVYLLFSLCRSRVKPFCSHCDFISLHTT
nr:MAG TPA: iron-binding zinc finger protein [Caudoviricetes sp.]